MTEVSVVIVTWNSRDEVVACLDALRDHPPSRAWETVVVDNGSTDGTVGAVRAAAEDVCLIANPTNRGLPAANNQGLVAGLGRYVLVCNPDVKVCLGAVDALCDVLDRNERCAIAVPQIVQAGGPAQTSAGDLPSLLDALLGGLRRTRFWWHDWDHAEEAVIGHGAEACYLVRREAVVEVGPQDERFVLDWEGIDWSDRMTAAGWEVRFTPAAVVEHVGGASIRQARRRWVVSSHRGMYRYFRQRRPLPMAPLLAAAFGLRAGAKLAAEVLGGRLYERAQHRAGRW